MQVAAAETLTVSDLALPPESPHPVPLVDGEGAHQRCADAEDDTDDDLDG